MPDLLDGRVSLTIDSLPAHLPHIKAGRLKVLAVTDSQRSPALPDTPTMAESDRREHEPLDEELPDHVAAAGAEARLPALPDEARFASICGARYMAPLYDPARERPEQARVCIDQFELDCAETREHDERVPEEWQRWWNKNKRNNWDAEK